MNDWCDEVLSFWFQELDSSMWFKKDERVDAMIRMRFLTLYERVAQPGGVPLEDARSHLAAVLVLDQMPRNMFRGSPRAYARDSQALAIAQQAIAAGLDMQLERQQRFFLYMPFQHSEDPGVQARSVELFTALGDANGLDYARQHREIIERFGRFPHRNAVLGRQSSPEELRFMETHSGF
ncbi:hypothetical protein ACG33_00955 [Steroidobacter denitrificans]|uniref:Transmembrane protein n=1 Tax=Steroidobacter denitrificans TaxID=465721 RepID=A0A127F5J6_STEDE|nr:DUF924 family protein [Steroidobacter denitrificans]AMN45697.1 hypothetical protein ACG33_00955 [Steroidobacter denitrificans]